MVSYLGVPFAQPPIESLRWAPPQRVSKSIESTVRDARSFGPACMQGPHLVNWYQGVIKSFGGDPDSFSAPNYSEDCLYLNIWAPQSKPQQGLPVLVFIHGGSNKGGWSYEPNYLGEQLAAKGLVVVTIAYRLGAFGFFSHPELEHANFALLDQITALEWLRDNIQTVGGDPQRITVAGESSGASNIAYLMASPLAKGLFQRAIHQSGGWAMYGTDSKADAESFALKLAAQANAGNLSELRQLDAEGLQILSEQVYAGHFFDPVVDGQSIVKPLIDSVHAGELANIDLMIGSNANEARMYLPAGGTIETWLANNVPAEQQRVTVASVIAQQDQARSLTDRLDELATAYNYACPSHALAKAKPLSSAWVYHFERVRPGDLAAEMGAYHGAELPYMFNTHDEWLPTDQNDRILGDQMMAYWANFAASGNPNGQGLVYWPPFSAPEFKVQTLNTVASSGAHPSSGLCRLIEF